MTCSKITLIKLTLGFYNTAFLLLIQHITKKTKNAGMDLPMCFAYGKQVVLTTFLLILKAYDLVTYWFLNHTKIHFHIKIYFLMINT
jgi:hypothetical protein